MRLNLLCILFLAIALTGCPKETKPSRATQSPPDRIRMAFHSPTQTMPAGVANSLSPPRIYTRASTSTQTRRCKSLSTIQKGAKEHPGCTFLAEAVMDSMRARSPVSCGFVD